MLNWNIEEKELPLKYSWNIARSVSTNKRNFFVTVDDGSYSGKGEAAPNLRYGETPELIRSQFERFCREVPVNASFHDFLEASQGLCNALRFGIESAYVHYTCKKRSISAPDFLEIDRPGPVYTSYTLPIMPIEKVKTFLDENDLERFRILKLKVNRENALELTRALRRYTTRTIIIDGNETWADPDEVLRYLEQVRYYGIGFLEQPMPASSKEAYRYLKKQSPLKLFADESVTDDPDLEDISQMFHGINMKLMKAGGYRNGLKILKDAKDKGLETMIGCMVETSLGIWSALQIASQADHYDLDGHFLIENDPYNYLVTEQTGALFSGY